MRSEVPIAADASPACDIFIFEWVNTIVAITITRTLVHASCLSDAVQRAFRPLTRLTEPRPRECGLCHPPPFTGRGHGTERLRSFPKPKSGLTVIDGNVLTTCQSVSS